MSRKTNCCRVYEMSNIMGKRLWQVTWQSKKNHERLIKRQNLIWKICGSLVCFFSVYESRNGLLLNPLLIITSLEKRFKKMQYYRRVFFMKSLTSNISTIILNLIEKKNFFFIVYTRKQCKKVKFKSTTFAQ